MSTPINAAWDRLRQLPQDTLSSLFEDAGRVGKLSGHIDWQGEDGTSGILFDWSKTHLDDALLGGFEELAQLCGFVEKRAELFSGERVNVTEGRAAEHTAQRGFGAEASVEEAAGQKDQAESERCATVRRQESLAPAQGAATKALRVMRPVFA